MVSLIQVDLQEIQLKFYFRLTFNTPKRLIKLPIFNVNVPFFMIEIYGYSTNG